MRTPPNSQLPWGLTPATSIDSAIVIDSSTRCPPGRSARCMPASERAVCVGHEVAEAVAPAHEPVHRADVGQRPQVAGDEARRQAGLGRRGAGALELAGREVDPDDVVAGRRESQRDPPVGTRHVEHRRARRQIEQLADEPRVGVGHRRARRAPEAGGQSAVEADEPVVQRPRVML